MTSVPAGSHSLSAMARDLDGASTTSATVSVTVNAPNQLPSVSITAPASGAVFTAPATITVSANASDPENRLNRVDFFRNGAFVASDSTAPFGVSMTAVPVGSYSLTAVALDLDGGSWTSAAVTLTVNAPANQPPVVTLTAPVNGATFTAPATITLTASASDPEGRLSRVEFYVSGTLITSDTAAPFTLPIPNVPAGSYSFTARAVDLDGLSATTAAAMVTVNAQPPPPPRLIVFQKSVDHASVASYLLEVFAAGANPATATPIATSNLGKPTPAANGDITVDRATFFAALAPGSYQATVSSINANGRSRSAPLAFTR
jgi:predicted phage tail protein